MLPHISTNNITGRKCIKDQPNISILLFDTAIAAVATAAATTIFAIIIIITFLNIYIVDVYIPQQRASTRNGYQHK